MQLKTVRSVCS